MVLKALIYIVKYFYVQFLFEILVLIQKMFPHLIWVKPQVPKAQNRHLGIEKELLFFVSHRLLLISLFYFRLNKRLYT